MPRKKSYITFTDQFCGAGGSSQGVRRLSRRSNGGIEVKLALNHWKLAIETHNTNFPDTLHDCTDISAADPRRYPSTDILITSPECTTHSPAGGNNHKSLKKQMDMFDTGKIDPATERSRATMWDVCRFAEYHKYRCIIVENVVEAKTRWALFDTWLTAMHVLGYNHKLVFHNSMHHHPTPQSRDRMYIVFWQKGNKEPNLDFTPPAYCPKCACDVQSVQTWKDKRKNWGKYGIKNGQYVYCCPMCTAIVEPYYHAAFNCIDWSDIGERIGDRKKPLAEKTLSRIQYGLDKYGKQPLMLHTSYGAEARNVCRSAYQHGFTQTTAQDQAFAIPPMPFLIDDKQSTGIGFRVKSVASTTSTIHTDPRVRLVMPFIYTSSHGGDLRPSALAKGTQTTQESEALVIPPIVPVLRGTSKANSSLDALNTVSAGGIHAGILTTESWNSFLSYYYKTPQASGINESINTVNCNDRAAIINYQAPAVEDCYYRMLYPRETKLAMAFDGDYVVLGSGKDQVKQLGNAVTPPAMEWLAERCVESLS